MATKAKTAAKPRGKAFPKGVSGNPAGSVATELRFESAFKRILAQALDAKTVKEYDGALNRMDRLAHKAIKILEDTDNEQVFFAGLDKIADRTEGKARQQLPVDKEGNEVKAVMVQFVDGSELSTTGGENNGD